MGKSNEGEEDKRNDWGCEKKASSNDKKHSTITEPLGTPEAYGERAMGERRLRGETGARGTA
ncbi:hypothetical protein E2C01_093840 [Portunus trituberculatus]|uniref:Uncharacterized protein n=1 Tax=Portunus trituberculatus TaxID=210409 RepID=A0A5B7JZT8_PORTR|nr:hypothetical protein [Portunus trituberculatus]